MGLLRTARKLSGFPYICEFDNMAFSYIRSLGTIDYTRQVFIVEQPGKDLVVKFAKQYSEAAHRLLAETVDGESFAPALHYVSPDMYGGRRMIVMDYVDGKRLERLEEGLSDAQREQLKRALGRLHENGLVFGDLREPNVMIKGDRVLLVDFDWSGKEGETRYPLNLNTKIVWAQGVEPGAVILKKHDEEMLEKLK